MPDIGASLREARMRQRIDISEIEAQTKIRAKYLRALENEEWDLLPGPTFVKSFLKTYAEALGLDARALLEEYKMRYEGLSDADLAITPPSRSQRERAAKRAKGPSVVRDVLIAVLFVGLVAVLIALGSGGDDDPESPAGGVTSERTTTTTTRATTTTSTRSSQAPQSVRLRLNPTGDVFVCLKVGDRVRIDQQILTASTPTRTYRGRRMRILLGTDNITLTVNGTRKPVASSADPIAYEITSARMRRIEADPGSICA